MAKPSESLTVLWPLGCALALAGALGSGCGKNAPVTAPPTADAGPSTPFLVDAGILVHGVGVTTTDCRGGFCQHDENTDMIRWNGAIYLVHRTAMSQGLGPNSSLHIYRSTDEGATFPAVAKLLAPGGMVFEADGGSAASISDAGLGDGGFEAPCGRDLRDPAFYIVGDALYLKALTRVPSELPRDTGVNTLAVESHTTDGVSWSPLDPIGPADWSFWRIKEENGVYYSAAYHDGDSSVALFSSTDGVHWTQGADIFTVSADTPLETELTFMPSGRLLALVRTDGDDMQLLGDDQLMTQVCWALPPYASFSCDAPLQGVRLDGPLSLWVGDRLFVVARKHLGASDKKRTAVYEITGTLEGGPIGIQEWLVLPSAGDTSYAGGVLLDSGEVLLSWYSGDLALDEIWVLGMGDATNIWLGTLGFAPPG